MHSNGITNIPISAIVFASPHVGNQAFNDRLNQFSNVKILNIRNKTDLIQFEIDTRKSRSL
ncbi:putative fungal lipase-like domain, alpha/Beta hydrolase, phospholipase A1-II [Helianthus anomalus]